MPTDTAPQPLSSRPKIKQLLDIVVHSLYTEKEIFVPRIGSPTPPTRWKKLRHLQLTEKEIYDGQVGAGDQSDDRTTRRRRPHDPGFRASGMTRAELVE